MKFPSLILIATLLSASGATFAASTDDCTGRRCGRYAPMPPAPPTPPSPPSMPAPPAPPSPPAPPLMVDAPAAAHALCSGKAPGSAVSYKGKTETMSGTCERDNRGMYFEIEHYRSVK